eukprot:PhF_6_TR8604/c0_g1_i1/m.13417
MRRASHLLCSLFTYQSSSTYQPIKVSESRRPPPSTTRSPHLNEPEFLQKRQKFDRQQQRQVILLRLQEEHGIGINERKDAFILGTEKTVYPAWVHDLPSHELNDLFSGVDLNLTETDMFTKRQLSTLPVKKRIHEWDRRKAAHLFHDTPPEAEQRVSKMQQNFARNSRQSRYQSLAYKAQKITLMRRQLKGRPQRFSAEPSDRVDYSRRLAAAARAIEERRATNGVWPVPKPAKQKKNFSNHSQDESQRGYDDFGQ